MALRSQICQVTHILSDKQCVKHITHIFGTSIDGTRCLKQQWSIAVPLIICRPSKANFRFPFPFGANKRKFAVSVFCLQLTNGSCRFPLVLFSVCRIQEIWRAWKHGDRDMETWRHRHEIWKRGDMETWRQGDMDTRTRRHGHGDMDMETWIGRHGQGYMDMRHGQWRHGIMLNVREF